LQSPVEAFIYAVSALKSAIHFGIHFIVKQRIIALNNVITQGEKSKVKSPETRINKGISRLFTWWLIGESNPGHLD